MVDHAPALPAATPAQPGYQVLPPEVVVFPPAVERTMVLRAAGKLATAQAELMRYLVDGPYGLHLAFQDEVAPALAAALREILNIEGARLGAMASGYGLADAGERETLNQLLGSITRFQEEWGRG